MTGWSLAQPSSLATTVTSPDALAAMTVTWLSHDYQMTGVYRTVGHMPHLNDLLGPQDLADYLGVPVATLYAWRHRGEGPPGFRVGRHIRYRTADVEAWVTKQLEADLAALPNREEGRR